MKKKLLLLGIIFIMGAAVLFAQAQSITIVNNTGYTIYLLYVSHSSSSDWEEDVLGDDTLSNGESFRVNLPSGGTWDIMLVDEDGDTYTKIGVSAGSRVVFTLADLD